LIEQLLSAGALFDFTAQFPIRFPQGVLGLFPLGDVCHRRLDHLTAAPLNAGQGHIQRYLLTIRREAHPFETRAPLSDAFLNIFTGQHSGAFTIRLERG